uniref:Sua5/YciO/YrdC/YwlC family protein n=1 Tax=Streptomyces lushanensis TaxID=1434255 RepID=UPI001B80BC99
MQVYNCLTGATRQTGIFHAAEALRSGQLTGFPTDTVYAIGANAFDPQAVHVLLAAQTARRRQACLDPCPPPAGGGQG